MMHLFEVGPFKEILITAERVVSVQADLDHDRAGNLVMVGNGIDPDRPRILGSIISLDNGTSIVVPQSPTEVGLAMSEAITRRTVMPS